MKVSMLLYALLMMILFALFLLRELTLVCPLNHSYPQYIKFNGQTGNGIMLKYLQLVGLADIHTKYIIIIIYIYIYIIYNHRE